MLLITLVEISAQGKLSSEVFVSMEKGTIQEYLDTLQPQIDAVFVYSDVIKPGENISIPTGAYKLTDALDSIFKNQTVSYVARENLIILSTQSIGKTNDDRIIVSGQIINRKSEPIPFATIYIENKSLGTIANAEGFFRFVLPPQSSSDTISISSLGYESEQIAPQEYLTKVLKIKLNASKIALKDVIVRPDNPEKIVMQSYNSRAKNYSDRHVVMNAFFRESSKQNDDYISLSEALIEIKKSSYSTELNDLVRLLKGRVGTNINQSEMVDLVVEGGLYNGLRLDVAKYGSYFYDEYLTNDCEYRMLKTIFYQNRQTYVIGFTHKEGIDYPGYEGTLYIDSESLALVRANFNLSEQGVRYSKSILVKKSPKGYKTKPVFANYEVEYRYYNNNWNLHYARSDVGLKIKKVRGKQNKGFTCNFTTSSEFVITGITEKPNKRIPFRAISKPNDVLVKQLENTEPTYWSEDNVILPEEPLVNTIRKLQQQGELLKNINSITKEE